MSTDTEAKSTGTSEDKFATLLNQTAISEGLIKQKLDGSLENVNELKAILANMQRNTNVAGPLAQLDISNSDGGVISKSKSWLLQKLSNITRNVVEKSWIRQQKFNTANLQALQLISERLDQVEQQMNQSSKED